LHIISKKTIDDFVKKPPDARLPLDGWLGIMKKEVFQNFSELRKLFPSADKVNKCTVFNIGGNKFRLIAAIHYNRNKIFIRHLLTPAEYNLSKWTDECTR
jgi:mRNA interferase HigB